MKLLPDLTKKDVSFIWRHEQEDSFNRIINYMSEKLLLHYPFWDKVFIISTDTSETGISGILLQLHDNRNRIPISICHRLLNSAKSKYSTKFLETLAVG